MKRGRPRKYDPTIPTHIDQQQIPDGVYWNRPDRNWFALLDTGQGRRQRKRLAGAYATLADLHRLMEDLNTGDRGSIAWLDGKFRESDQYKALSTATQRDYTACLRALKRFPTRRGTPVSDLIVDRLTAPLLQTLIDKIATDRPSMANHVKRYLGRLIRWGMARGHCIKRENPAHGLDAAKEAGQFKMPTRPVMAHAIAFARERGARTGRSAGACPAYLWIVMVLAYRCRLRGIEILTMNEAAANDEGVLARRRKGSKANRVRWSQELRDAWQTALQSRDAIWARRKMPVPMRAEDRPLLVNDSGSAISRSTLDSTWRRFAAMAIEAGVFTQEEYFTLHGLKHRGITDSKNKSDGGHVDPRMERRYDHDVPLVDPAGDAVK